MRLHGRTATLCLVAASVTAGSETTSISAPVLGIVWNRAACEVRQVLGIAGAAATGEVIGAAGCARAVAVSSSSDWALASAQSERPAIFLLRRLRAPAPEVLELPGAEVAASSIHISAGGKSALLLDAVAGRAQAITGLPEAPSMKPAFDVSAGEIAAGAISGQGQIAFAARGGIHAAGRDGETRLIAPAACAGPLLFLEESLIFSDCSRNEIYLVREPAGAAVPELLAGPNDGIDKPAAVQAARGRLVIASAGNRKIIEVDLGTRSSRAIDVPVTPDRLDPIGESGFVLSGPDSGPFYVFRPAGSPEVFFVPPHR